MYIYINIKLVSLFVCLKALILRTTRRISKMLFVFEQPLRKVITNKNKALMKNLQNGGKNG